MSLFGKNMNSGDHTTKHPIKPTLLVLLLTFNGCAFLEPGGEVYSSEVKSASSDEYIITVKSRLEQEGMKKSMSISHKTCNANQKSRLLLLDRSSLYMPSSQSEFETPYYKVISHIKCK